MTALPAMNEREYQDALVDIAHLVGYVASHFRPGQSKGGVWTTPGSYDSKGWPDLALFKPRAPPVFIECKGPKTPTDARQIQWLTRLASTGHARAWLLRSNVDDLTVVARWLAKPDHPDVPLRHGFDPQEF